MKLFKKLVQIGLGVGAAVTVVTSAHATQIHNNFGLLNPATTITFEERITSGPITNQYDSLGVDFSPFVYNYQVSFPNQSGYAVGPFGSPSASTVTLNFTQLQNAVAFSFASNSGTTLFEALLAGSVIDSFSPTTNATDKTNFFGFSNENFDAIRITAPGNHAFLLDNLQFVAPAVVPEPASVALLALGLLSLTAMRKRKQQ